MLEQLRQSTPKILVTGAHARIIQSVLDFDYVAGKDVPSIQAVVGGTRKTHKCYFGETEYLLPVHQSVVEAKEAGLEADWLLNVTSANSARRQCEAFFAAYPDALGTHIFAENVSERDALWLLETYGAEKAIVGPAGVGLLVPGLLKLGGIGGIFGNNINHFARKSGNVAIICSSGGMVNELIDSVIRANGMPSFAACYGGDRFPGTSPLQWFREAEADQNTTEIIYFGELGGYDEYKIAEAVAKGVIKKPIHAYVAGRYKTGEKRVQFGHAKALAKTPEEDAWSKMEALEKSGVTVYETFGELVGAIEALAYRVDEVRTARAWEAPLTPRTTSLFTAVTDRGAGKTAFAEHALCTLLEQSSVSSELVSFTEHAYALLIDHGAEPSGAVNTMITTRAGRDMGASLATGILTVGNRFGGAINGAAHNWYQAVKTNQSVEDLLEEHKARGEYVLGIGHRKYTIHNPDQRVATMIKNANEILVEAKHLRYAEAVALRTTEKRANLILNVDGAIAAIVLDLLQEKEGYSDEQLAELISIEFFNSYFIIPRTVGFIGNHLTQRRRDEGLFRLPESEVFYE